MLLSDVTSIRSALARWAAFPLLAADTETTGLDPLADRVLLLSLTNGQDTLLLDLRSLDPAAVAHALEPLRSTLLAMHNAKFDVRMLLAAGFGVTTCADTLLNELLLDNGGPEVAHGLADLCARHLGVALAKDERMGFTRVGTGAFSPAQLEYARRDVLATWHLLLGQVGRVEAAGLRRVARLESRLVPAVADMEQRGVFVDAPAWRAALAGAVAAQDAARVQLDRAFAPVCNVDLLGQVDINYDADLEVRAALSRLGLQLDGLHNDALREAGHPAATALLNYREAHKLVTTYGDAFIQHVHPRTGRIHATFRQLGASTGRMSCERPNLQNIPRGSELRSCFRAPEGRVLITADYAACELRILAHLSQDPVFLKAFAHGEDVHAQVASSIFGIPVTRSHHPELRERAKAISFGLIYGMGAAGLAAQIDQPLEQAEDLLRQYFQRFPRIDATLRGLEHTARRDGAARTVLGRRLLMDRSWWDRSGGSAARLARNMPIQGTSADITKLAMIYLHERLAGTHAFLVNCVHDELLVEAPAGTAEEVAAAVREEMERAMRAVIPSVVPAADVRVGATWSKG